MNKEITSLILSKNSFFHFLPSLGIIVFLISSLFITSLYPGGSELNVNSVGFTWSENYWCNLFESNAINGQVNLAQKATIIATIGMFLSLLLFFLFYAETISERLKRTIILVFGTISMLIAPLVMTGIHDIIVVISGIFCSIAILTIFKEMYDSKNYFLLGLGIIWVILFVINYGMYFGNLYIEKLPVVQKIAFLSFYAWIVITNASLVKKLKNF